MKRIRDHYASKLRNERLKLQLKKYRNQVLSRFKDSVMEVRGLTLQETTERITSLKTKISDLLTNSDTLLTSSQHVLHDLHNSISSLILCFRAPIKESTALKNMEDSINTPDGDIQKIFSHAFNLEIDTLLLKIASIIPSAIASSKAKDGFFGNTYSPRSE